MCRPKVLVVILGKTVDALVRNLPVFIFFSTFFGTGEDKFGTGERFLVLGRKFGSARSITRWQWPTSITDNLPTQELVRASPKRGSDNMLSRNLSLVEKKKCYRS